jgi:hypothetical protein
VKITLVFAIASTNEIFFDMPAKDFYHNTVKNALIKKNGELLKNRRLKLIAFDPKQEEIKQWIVPN